MATHEIRAMRMSDLSRVSALDELCQPHPWGPANFQGELLRTDDGFNRIVEIDGSAIAYLCCWMVLDELHIGTIGVHPDHRRKRLGLELMSACHDWARLRSGTIAHLEVRAGNAAAIRMYEQLNYRRVGIRKGYYADNLEDAHLLMANL
ncbi:MAG: ribosomal-protein-alanine N-acetyltransferase [Fibrobacterota bacterium]|jgi:ribosomal-protein-alanine N-acetyltransferase